MYYASGNYEAFARPRRPAGVESKSAYIIGTGLAALTAAAVFYCVYRSVALSQFGGFTGDLAGWFLQVCELVILAAVVLTERVCAIWF